MKFLTSAVLASLLASASTTAEENKLHQWGQMALMDVQAIYDTLNAHHMGPVDPENPGYKIRMDKAFLEVKEKIKQVKTYGGYRAAVRYFSDSFEDGHINAVPLVTQSREKWPGFKVKYFNGNYKVSYIDAGVKGITIGDSVLTCDGRPLDKIFNETVAPYYGINGLMSDKINYAPFIFRDMSNPFIDLPKSCEFKGKSGTYTQALQWQDMRSHEWRDFDKADEETEFSLTEVDKDIFWISMPTFFPSGDQVTALQNLIKEVQGKADVLRNAKKIVFDVRHNTGGSSQWADQIVNAIWGEGFVDRAYRKFYDRVEWRASEENVKTIRYYQNLWTQRAGKDHAVVQELKSLADGIEVAVKEGKPFHAVPTSRKMDNPIKAGEVKPNVYLFTDNDCFSSCLDFADTILSIPEAKHIGAETGADAIYIDNRGITLPSNSSFLSFSMKVYRGRHRGHNQPYVPEIRYTQDDWSTKSIQDWFLKISQ